MSEVNYEKLNEQLTEKGNILLNPIFLGVLGFALLFVHSQGKAMDIDEGIWSYMGRVWADNGLVPYTGTINNKPPGIFLLYYYSYLLFGTNIWFTRLVGDIASMGASLCLFAFVRRISGSVYAAAISAGLYILLMPLRRFHISAGYTETFLIFFVLLSLLLLVLAVELEGRRSTMMIFAAGLSAGAALSFKQVALFDVLGIVIIAIFLLSWRYQVKGIMKAIVLLLFGVMITTVVGILLMKAHGCSFADYIDQVWGHLFKGREAKIGAAKRMANVIPAWSRTDLIIPYIAIAGFLIGIKWMRFKIPAIILLVWLGLEFVAVNATGTYYQHQFKQILPAMCVISGISLDFMGVWLCSKFPKLPMCKTRGVFASVIIMAILLCYIPFNKEYAAGLIHMFAPRTDSNKELAYYVKDITADGEFIYVYGSGGYQVLSYSGRVAPTAYFIHFLHMYPGAMEQLQKDFSRTPPILILLPIKGEIPEWLHEIVSGRYEPLETRNRFDIFVLDGCARQIRERKEKLFSQSHREQNNF
ncbi:MAG: glycosyltransferase family 39 protein [Sedimentisphaerales bacterium]|jgi:hypothetical protein